MRNSYSDLFREVRLSPGNNLSVSDKIRWRTYPDHQWPMGMAYFVDQWYEDYIFCDNLNKKMQIDLT